MRYGCALDVLAASARSQLRNNTRRLIGEGRWAGPSSMISTARTTNRNLRLRRHYAIQAIIALRTTNSVTKKIGFGVLAALMCAITLFAQPVG